MDQTKIRSSKIPLHALGRQFSLGELYDCRSERIIARKSLWSSDVISKAFKTRTKRNTTHDILTNVTFDMKLKLFHVDNDLKASILTNLVSLSGSSKYLYDQVPSNIHEKVTLHFKCTTKFEELDIENLIKEKTLCPEVFTNGIGTHVVCGIQYGGEAFFVFDSLLSDECQGSSMSLQEAVAKLPKIKSDGTGRLSLPRELEEQTNGIRFKLYSDFPTPHCSNRYRDAGKLFNTLSHSVDGKRNPAVAVEYLLYPLLEMDSFAAYPVRHVSVNIVSQLENTNNHLNKLINDCSNMGSMAIIKKFPDVKRDIEEFLQLLRSYKQHLQEITGRIVTRIRTGSLRDIALETVLREKEESPFRQHQLDNWVQQKIVHLKILSHDVSKTARNTSNIDLPGTRSSQRPANKPQSLAKTTLSSVVDSQSSFATTPKSYSEDSCLPDRSSSGNVYNSDFIVCFHVNMDGKISLTKMMKSYLQYMKSGFLRKAVTVPVCTQSFENTLQKAEQFQDFVEANQLDGRLKFNFSENSDGSGKPDVYVTVMKNGTVIHQNYQAPSAPGCAKLVRSVNDKLEIKWSVPEFGSDGISNYEVLYKEVKGSCSSTVQVGDDSLEYTIRNLKSGEAYEIQVRAACEIGVSKWSSCSFARTLPATAPGKPDAFHQVPNDVVVRWSKPQDIAPNAQFRSYMISVTDVSAGGTFSKEIDPQSGEEATFSNLRATSSYNFKVKARFEEGDTEESEVSDILRPKPNTVMKEKLLADSKQIKKGNPARHRLKLNQTFSNHEEKIRKCELGKSCNVSTEKVIMVVGATGAGKTTLINGLVNHVLGVDWKDNFRFQLIVDEEEAKQRTQAQSQTRWITSYTLHHQEGFKVPYSLTVVDTPGFGDTSGIKRDQEITKQVRTFFTTQGDEGLDHIDAIGFVTQASLPRLTPTQQFIFDQVLSLFGKDISDNIFLLVTFADGQKPPVLEGVKMAAIPIKDYFKFNNSALYAEKESGNRHQHMPTKTGNMSGSNSEDSDDNDFDEMFWKMGEKSFLKFFKTLKTTQAKSISLTQDVLNERQSLETHVAGIHQHIRTGLTKLEQLRIEVDVLHRHEVDIEMNKDFTFTVTEDTVKLEDIPTGTFITNCLTCNYTCHYPCFIPDDEQKKSCAAMDITKGFCTVCPKHCFWNVHKNMTYRCVIVPVKKLKTSEDLKARYKAASGKKLTAEELVNKVMEDFDLVQLKVLFYTDEVRKSLERLKEIALKPNPLSTVEYIDIMIMSEESKMLPGWKDRKEQLEEVRQKAETLQLLAEPGFDPFEKCKTTYTEMRKKNESNGNVLQKIKKFFQHR
ncbi:uncharacterized protein [Apostichopus japonicus]|uniref:uncharacterized protein n=1 Tax=Stichopus japonicus TaxID=307972 RepID=UPI003AB7AA7D